MSRVRWCASPRVTNEIRVPRNIYWAIGATSRPVTTSGRETRCDIIVLKRRTCHTPGDVSTSPGVGSPGVVTAATRARVHVNLRERARPGQVLSARASAAMTNRCWLLWWLPASLVRNRESSSGSCRYSILTFRPLPFSAFTNSANAFL